MPGPKATRRITRSAAPNSPTAKVRRRLKARREGKPEARGDFAKYEYHLAGSENRKK